MNLAAHVPIADKLTTPPSVPFDRRLSGGFTHGSSIAPGAARSVGILSTYPPTQCGLASFASSLRSGLLADRPDTPVGVVRIGSTTAGPDDAAVAHVLDGEAVADSHEAADALNQFDMVIIQHEFGIYGGADGEQILEIVNAVRAPIVLVAHTVPARPSINQRRILESLVESVDVVVTMSRTARLLLLADYRAEPGKIMLIPHGAAPVRRDVRRPADGAQPVILTWGLLGPGKGIELGIAALSVMDPATPRPTYVVAGQTHPKVFARDGEGYRSFLTEHAGRLGVQHLVRFIPGYLSTDHLGRLLAQADVVLLPYDSQEQVTSGVLAEALAAGVPVVSTAFPHAVELLAGGRGGLVVPHDDPEAIAAALTRIFTEPGLADAMSTHNAKVTTAVSWPTVARRYRQVFDGLLRRSLGPVR
ncbi:glycosyltransferase [Hamadaea sp. NPDC051192]|uniref:glycosyltransferase n=1 Tax=Hamadaea sp. NPDC051192 TaxID=3154940 RepID=UPI003419459F